MLRRLLWSVFLMVICQVAAQCSSIAEDEATIRTVVEATSISRLVGNADRTEYERYIATDIDWENAFGVHKKGLAELLDYLHQVVAPNVANTREIPQELRIQFLAPGFAFADRYVHLLAQDAPEGEGVPERRLRITYLLKKDQAQWKVIVIRMADLRAGVGW